jgi:CRISPR-associated endoribonuclease Cas6
MISTQLRNLPFTLAAFTFHLTAKERIELPAYKGSAFRGGFGHVMKKVCCLMPGKRLCDNCQMPKACAYAYIFETPINGAEGASLHAKNLPHPFVIEPPLTPRETIHAGEKLSFGLTLIGKGIDFLPYFIYAFHELGRSGVGRGRGRYQLDSITDALSQNEIYHGPTQTLTSNFTVTRFADSLADAAAQKDTRRITLQFLTPTHLLRHGQLVAAPSFEILLRRLLARASELAKIHVGQPWELDYRQIVDTGAASVRLVEHKLEWQNWERYSNRQQQRMKFRGFVGTVAYEGEIQPFLPFIILGQYLHIGNKTSFGMGKYEIQWQ